MDKIERSITVKASQSRVWRAVSDSKEFGTWFEIALDGPFVAGTTVKGSFPTMPEFAHVVAELVVERVEPERLLAFRWHPFAIEKGVDYSHEPMTLVEIALSPASGGGTLVTVTESGFDKIPAERRARAFEMDDRGWAEQMRRIAKYVDAA